MALKPMRRFGGDSYWMSFWMTSKTTLELSVVLTLQRRQLEGELFGLA
jgi:hypothetical protein